MGDGKDRKRRREAAVSGGGDRKLQAYLAQQKVLPSLGSSYSPRQRPALGS